MAKRYGFTNANATKITEEDVETLRKNMQYANERANYEQNKTTMSAPKYKTLPTLNKTTATGNAGQSPNGLISPSLAPYNDAVFTQANPKATTGYQTNTSMYNYASKDKLSSDEKKAVKKEYKNLKKYGIEENTDNQRQKLKNAIDDGTLSADYVNAVKNAYMKSSMEGQAMTGIVNLGSALAEPVYLGGSLYERAKGKEGVWTEANNARKETLAELNKANPVGATIGSFAGKGIQYAAANELMNGIPVLKNAKDAMAGSLGGKTGEMLADVTFDMIPDLALDTLPTEVDNYLSGMSGKDIAKDTAKNIATNYAFNLIMGGLQNGKGIADELSANRQNARTNELAKNWLGLDKEAMGDAFEDNTKKAIADQLRAENPTLLGRLSDEDVYQFYLNSVEDDLKNQNYENIKNVINNTDNSVPTLKSNGVEETSGLDLMSNYSETADAIKEFRANNPSMQVNMTDRDVLNYIQASNEAKALEAQNRGIYDILENTDETNATIPRNADDVDIDNMLREAGLEDYITEEPTYTKPLPVNERFEDLKNDSSMKGVAKEYTDKDVVNGIRFRTPEERTLFKERLNNFYKAVDAIDDVTSKEELDVARANINKAFAELGDSLKNGGHLDNSQREVNKKLRQQLFASLEGTKIYVDDLARAELKDFRTIREMNNKFGKNVFTSNPNVEGAIPIDMMWSQIDDLTGGQLGDMPSHNGDAINRLIELSQDLRSNSKLSNFVADDIRVSDVISDDLKNELREVVGVYDNFFNNNPTLYKDIADISTADNNILDLVEQNAKALDDTNANKVMAESMGTKVNPTPTETVDVQNPMTVNRSDVPRINTETTMSDGSMSLTSGEIKERGYSRSIKDKTDLPDVVKNEFIEEPELYEVLSNKATQAAADEITRNSTTTEATQRCLTLLSQKNPVAVPLCYDTAKRLIDEGSRDDAVTLLRMLSESLTESGQFSQAAAITLMHSDPMTALRYMEREIDSLNKNGLAKYGKKWKDFSLTDDEIKMFNNINPGDEEAIKSAYEQVSRRLAKEYPSTKWEKFIELEKLSMLLNPRTHIRNFGANAMLLPIRSASDRVSALGQNIVHLFNPETKVTQSMFGGTRLQKKIANQVFDEEFKAMLDNSDKWDSLQGLARDKQVFNDDIATKSANWLVNKMTGGRLQQAIDNGSLTDSMLENLRRFDYWLLGTVEDDPFVKKNFSNRLASYMKAQNINNIADIPSEAKAIAWEEALKATFKDDNQMTAMLSGIKKNLGKFGEVLFPFTKTPANLAVRAIDYSPVGIAKAMASYYKMPINARNVGKLFDDMSKGITGSAGILLGYQLAKNGVITGKLSDDKDTSAFEKMQGKQAFSVNIGNNQYSYDWAQPAATSLIMGASIYDAIKESDTENEDALKTLGSGLVQGGKAAFDSWFDLSPLQTLQEVLSGDEYGSTAGGISDRVIDSITEMPQRLIPSVLGASARTADPTMRETFDKTSGLNTWVNSAKAKTFASDELPAKYDAWGRERKRSNSKGGAAFAQFVNPGQVSNPNKSPIDDEILAIAKDAGDVGKKAYPNVAGWTVDGKDLTAKEHSEYQRDLGQLSYKMAETYLKKSRNRNIDSTTKAETLNELYSFSNAVVKAEQFGYDLTKSDKYSKLNDIYKSKGESGVVEYLINQARDKSLRSEMEEKGYSTTDTALDMYKSGKTKELEAYTAITTIPVLDKKGNETHVAYTDKTKQIYADKKEQGIKNYALVKNQLGDKSGNADLVKAVETLPVSEREQAYYFSTMHSGDMASAVRDKDNVTQYRYYKYGAEIDTNNSHSYSNEELKQLLPALQRDYGKSADKIYNDLLPLYKNSGKRSSKK